ncbi:unnamed protein product [Plutella xylostella]|uniref:(diamondback moth) hypothetical protein n=1 Tax=Plutella xylostella TaxID=51655 RepID=A0A8S4GBD6_PLUXY|nr:unnamed protein product [Plutella xylostella]
MSKRRQNSKEHPYMSILNSYAPVSVVDSHRGETLELSHVQRADMGNYYCIASNGVPPSVSRRYSVQVHCEFYLLHAKSQF